MLHRMSATLVGIALQLVAIAFFVAMDTTTKLLTASYSVPQLMFARFLFHLLFVALLLRLLTGSLPWRSRAPRLQAARSLSLVAANFIFSHALIYLPLADATAVGFASPLLTVALAAWWLRERVSPRRWLGVCIGLVGVAVALRPPFLTGGPLPHWSILLPLGTAACFAVYQVMTRRLATIDDPRTTVLHTGFAGALVTSLAQPMVWLWPDAIGWVGLVALGVLGAAGHWLLIAAFARAPASLLSPLSYSQLLWAALASALLFGDLPDVFTLLGASIIAAGGLLVALPERRR